MTLSSKVVDLNHNLILAHLACPYSMMQWTKSALNSISKGEKTNLTKEFQDTDRTIQKIRWKTYGPQKLFDTKLRFRIRLDDFRGYLVTSIEEGNADEQTIEEVLAFYNMATSTVLNFLATGWTPVTPTLTIIIV